MLGILPSLVHEEQVPSAWQVVSLGEQMLERVGDRDQADGTVA
jgi:hypothetical protein